MENTRKCKALATALQEDRISGLPNEVVLTILSHLTMKEAVRTSILSPSWKDLWKAYSGCLDFGWLIEYKDIPQAACRYRAWVDKVLDSLESKTIQGLRIVFDMNKQFSGPIDRWIDFAISKKVGSLVLDLWGGPCGKSTLCFGTLQRFQEIKHLELNIDRCLGDSILCSGTFLHASTHLEKLVLKLTWRYPGPQVRRKEKQHKCEGCMNKCLKELVYVGWLGLDAEVKIVELLIQSARSTLERITINLCYSHNEKNAIKLRKRCEKEIAKARAMQLQQKLASSKAELVIH